MDTGNLRRSFLRGMAVKSETEVYVGSNVKTAIWHHEGTRPYRITAKSGKALRFPVHGGYTKSGRVRRGVAYARYVNHPGLASRPLLPSQHLAARMVGDEARAYVRRLIAAKGGNG